MKWIPVLVFMFCTLHTYTQLPGIDSTYSKTLAKSYETQNEIFLSGLKKNTSDKKLMKYYESTYREIFKAVQENIKDGRMANHPSFSLIIERILKQIRTQNPEVPVGITFMLFRENQPNALTVGDSSILLNMGLFYYLGSEDEIAAVLSHEIAHILLAHGLVHLKIKYEVARESKTNAKALSQVETKKADRAFDMLKGMVYKDGEIRRRHEMEADSFGYILFKNSGYGKAAFANVLEIVSHHDSIVSGYLPIEAYKRFFDFPKQPFNVSWMKEEDFSSYKYSHYTEKLHKDSISSHPNSNDRIKHLQHIFPELNNSNTNGDTTAFAIIKLEAEKELVPNLFANEKYGEAIYKCLIYLEANENNAYYRQWLGKSFHKIYSGRKDYQLNRYLDSIYPQQQSESYIRFLNFMWNLKLDELKNIVDYYSPQL